MPSERRQQRIVEQSRQTHSSFSDKPHWGHILRAECPSLYHSNCLLNTNLIISWGDWMGGGMRIPLNGPPPGWGGGGCVYVGYKTFKAFKTTLI